MAPPKGFKHSPEAIAKIAAASRARVFSPESNAKKSAALKGRKLSDEMRAKLSAAAQGRPQSPEQRAGIKKWLATPRFRSLNCGRKLSLEHRAKIAAAGIGNAHTKGRPLSAEHRALLSVANKTSEKAAAHRARMFAASPSSIERIIHVLLTELGVPFEPQKAVGPYSVDIFVPSHRIAIECDGEYWHRHTAERDRRRDEYMQALGFRVLRLPESDIRSGKSFDVVRSVLAT